MSLARLDENYRVIPGTNRLLELPTNYGVWGAEDPRLMLADDRLLLSYSDGLHTGLCELKPDGTPARSTVIAANPFDASLALTKDTREKNWGFFSHGGKIFVSYWVAPHIVFAYDERQGKLGRRWVTPWTPPIAMDKLHGSSPPVWHDGLFWRVVHSSPMGNGGRRTYRLWLMAFAETPPFEPRWFCQEPLVIAEAERAPIPEQIQHEVVFCGSIERTAEGWHLFFGENDRRMRHGVIEDALITPHVLSVAQAQQPNGSKPAVSKKTGNITSLPSNIGPCDIVVISLPERKDRRNRVRKLFAQERLPFRFADGVRVSDAEIEPWEISAVGWEGKEGVDRALYLRGLVGCKRAHVRCLEEALLSGAHALLLGEDDVAFRENWRSHLEAAVAQAPAGWLQIYLSGHPFAPTRQVAPNLQRANGLWLTTAVLYSKAGIREALASARNARCEIDHWLGIDLHPRGASYLMDPIVAYQVSGFSDSRVSGGESWDSVRGTIARLALGAATRISSIVGEDEALATLVVGARADVLIIVRREHLAHARRLIVPDLQREQSAQMPRCVCDEALDECEPVRAAIQREHRIAPHFARECGDRGGVDVRKIRDDELEFARDAFEQIAFCKSDAFRESEPRGIFARQRERIVGNIHRLHARLRPRCGERERDHAASGAHIQDAIGRRFLQQQLAKLLRLRPWDQCAFVAKESAPEELDRPEQMLQRFARRPALHQPAEWLQHTIFERAVEFHVQIHPLFPEHVREQVLDVQPRTFDAAFLQIGRRRLDDFEHGFHGTAACSRGGGVAQSRDGLPLF